MTCEECEYRFICFTTKKRPIKVKINWKLSSNCGRCVFSEFKTTTRMYKTTKKRVGLCDKQKLIIHEKSETCKDFLPKSTRDIDTIYKELRRELSIKVRGTKLPKYCERD